MDEREMKQALEYPAMQATIYQWMEEEQQQLLEEQALQDLEAICIPYSPWVEYAAPDDEDLIDPSGEYDPDWYDEF